MKLIYLFIDDFAPFKQTEMKFVADYDCSFDKSILSVKETKRLPEKFFSDNTGELFVSALVGKNGVGKTSLIRFLEALHYFPARANKFVMLLEAKGDLRVYYNLGGEKLVVNAQHCEVKPVIDVIKQENSNDQSCDRYDQLPICFRTIYYSPYYSTTSPVNYPSPDNESDCYFKSISTTSKFNQIAQRQNQRRKGILLPSDVIFRSEEIRRAIRLFGDSRIQLPHPQSILLCAQDWRLYEILGFFSEIVQSEREMRSQIASGEAHLKNKLRCSENELGRLEKMCSFLETVNTDVFLDIFKCMVAFIWYDNVVWRDENFEKEEFILGRKIYELVTGQNENNEIVQPARDEIVNILKEFDCPRLFSFDLPLQGGMELTIDKPLGEFFERILNLTTAPNADGHNTFKISLGDSREDVIDLVNIYENCAAIGDFALFSFDPQLSAGEQTLLSFHSRIWEVFEEWRRSEAGKDGGDTSHDYARAWNSGWLIVLDEVEVTLHPEWQRTLVRDILKMFETSFKGANVHFIFATHSPILLSDIPSGNVVRLRNSDEEENRKTDKTDRKDDKTDRKDGDVKPQETFAANIFDLYRDSFFLNNGTMGAFAYDKVNVLLAKLKIKRNPAETLEAYLKRVNIGDDDLKVASLIGDPFLSRYIWRRLEELSDNADILEDEFTVSDETKEIIELRKKQDEEKKNKEAKKGGSEQ